MAESDWAVDGEVIPDGNNPIKFSVNGLGNVPPGVTQDPPHEIREGQISRADFDLLKGDEEIKDDIFFDDIRADIVKCARVKWLLGHNPIILTFADF